MGRENGQTTVHEEGTHPTTAPAQNQTNGAQWQMVREIIKNDVVDKANNHIVNYQHVYPEKIVKVLF
jgi:hypothetical protein